MSGCPDLAEELTPEWCTTVMRTAGVLAADAAVTDVSCAPLGDVRGYFSRLFRLRLTYAPADAGPAVAIAKLPSSEMWNRTLGFTLGCFQNELRFYDELSGEVPVRVPTYYGGSIDEGAQRFALLLEDVSAGRQVDQSEGCSVDDAAAGLGELARLQAAWWASPRLDQVEWLGPLSKNSMGIAMGYDMACDGFLADHTAGLPEAAVAAVEPLRGRVPELLAAMCEGPHTLVHGDFRLDNLVFPTEGAGGPPLLFDWQNVARGSGFMDVAQMIALSLPPEVRRTAEEELLRGYVAALGSRVTEAEAWEGYRCGAAFAFVLAVSQTIKFTEQTGSDVSVWIERSAAAVADLGLPTF